MKTILLIVLLIIGGYILWKTQEPRLIQNNKYNCAVIGKMADCKTPLPEQDRLK